MTAARITLPQSGQSLAVYLINMKGAEQRLADMRDKLDRAGLPMQRIEGVNGKALDYPIPEFDERAYRLLHGRRTSPAEIGCYLSHIACARAFLDSDCDLALILEDDVSFEPDFLDALDRAAGQRDLWNILRLTTVNRGRKYRVRDLGQDRWLGIALTREKGAGAYVIDRAAAEWFTKGMMPMKLAFDIAFDLEYLNGLRAAFVDPLPASQISDHPTQIQTDRLAVKLPRWRYVTVLPYRAWLELSRLVCRGSRLMAARLSSGARHAERGGPGQKA